MYIIEGNLLKKALLSFTIIAGILLGISVSASADGDLLVTPSNPTTSLSAVNKPILGDDSLVDDGSIQNSHGISYTFKDGVLTLLGGTVSSDSPLTYAWDGGVVGNTWVVNTNVQRIIINGPINLSGSATVRLFSKMHSLTSISGMANLHTKYATDMSDMFSDDVVLTNLDVTSLDTSRVTNMESMFAQDEDLTSLDVSNFDTSHVTDMEGMFYSNETLTELDVSGFDTSQVTNMNSMFAEDHAVTNLDVSHFNTSKVTTMQTMFAGDSAITNLDVSGFDTSRVTNMQGMFTGDSAITSLDVSHFDTSQVTDMSQMFLSDEALQKLDVSNFNTSNVTFMDDMFSADEALQKLDVSNFNTSKVSYMYQMFAGDEALTTLDLSNFDTSSTHMRDMHNMFGGCYNVWKLKLGSKTELHYSMLMNPTYNAPIPDAPDYVVGPGPSNAVWREVGNGSDHNPLGEKYFSNDLETLTQSKDFNGGLFVWQQTKSNRALHVKPQVDLIVGDQWTNSDGFISATDAYNNNIYFKYIEVSGDKVDTSKVGTYNVIYNFFGIIKTTKVIVSEDRTSITSVPEIDLPVGSVWNAKAGFISATDRKGNAVTDFSKISVGGDKVDTSKPGTYNVTYTYGKRSANTKVKVVVTEDLTALNVKSEVDLAVGDKWQNSDGFISAFDKDGKKVGFTNIKVGGDKVDTSKAGAYNVTYTYGGKYKTTKVIVKAKATPNPTPDPTPNPTPNPTPKPTPTPDPTPTPTPTPNTEPGKLAKKGEVVYTLKKIYLYKNKDFKQGERLASYAKKPRVNRPMFVVTDYAKSKSGNLRYVVKDVNHHSTTDGMKGYITANYAYARPVYYHSTHKTLTVINPRGVNEYKNKNLTGKVKNIKQGTQLKVKGFVKHNLTTRYYLSNGHYITGNRKLVMMGKVKQPKTIKVKKTMYLYKNKDFKQNQRISKVKKGVTLKVKKWDYSNQYSRQHFGAKRYLVNGGYVTANKNFVKVVK